MNVYDYMEMIGCLSSQQDDTDENWLVEACRALSLSQMDLSRGTHIPQPRLSRLWQIQTSKELNRRIKLFEAERIIDYLYRMFMFSTTFNIED